MMLGGWVNVMGQSRRRHFHVPELPCLPYVRVCRLAATSHEAGLAPMRIALSSLGGKRESLRL